jgi:hypothetical protein
MALGNIQDREFQKFVDSPTRTNGSAVEVVGDITTSPGPFSIPSNCTCYTYSTGIDGIYFTEMYKFYESGTPASPVNLIKTVTLYYSDPSFNNDVGGVVG